MVLPVSCLFEQAESLSEKFPVLFTSVGEMNRAERAGKANMGLSFKSLSEGEGNERDVPGLEHLPCTQASGWYSEQGIGSGVRMTWFQVLVPRLLCSVTPGEVNEWLSFLIKEGKI